jgi:glycosyltransferase involved in cell wall biosynthesis
MDPRNLLRLIRLIKQEQVGILHAHGFGACMWARLAGHLLQVPVIVHGRCNYGKVPFIQRPVERILGPFTRYALAVSESTRQFTIQKRYIPSDRVDLLYNGIRLDRIPTPDSSWTQKVREEAGATPDIVVFGVVGRLESHKGIPDALHAFRRLLDKGIRAQLWIVGDGSEAERLKGLAGELGVQDHVFFTGFRQDVLKWIRCFDVQVFPSHCEGTPNTLFEALAVGNPIIATTADGQGEILSDGETALCCAPGDVGLLASHMETMATDVERRHDLAEAALKRAKDFDGHKTVAYLEKMYDRILSESRKTG